MSVDIGITKNDICTSAKAGSLTRFRADRAASKDVTKSNRTNRCAKNIKFNGSLIRTTRVADNDGKVIQIYQK